MPSKPARPALFLSHGSPMIALTPGAAGAFMRRLGDAVDRLWGRPRALVVMSPHTATGMPVVLGAARHHAVHDFGGFPQPLYELRYDARGDPALAQDVTEGLRQAGWPAQQLPQGGLDHGIWTALMYLYPQADVPVVPVSLTPQMRPVEVMAVGRALSGLARQHDVLLIGSGSLTHNLRRFFGASLSVDAEEDPQCAAFRAWVSDRAHHADWPALLDYRAQAPFAREMHPTDEHWLPFYFAAGAACAPSATGDAQASNDGPATARRLHASVTYGHLAMDAYGFGEGVAALAEELARVPSH